MTSTLNRAPADEGAGGKAAPPKKSKKKLIIIVLVLVVLIAAYEAQAILLKPHYKPGQKVPNGTILPMDQLTVNLSDGHLVQVTIALQLTTVANASVINADIPKFEDAIISVFGAQTDKGLLAPAGRDAAKAAILADCQKIAGTIDGAAPQISAVYYTGFIVQ